MKQNLFKKTRIATSMSLLLGATMHTAYAQDVQTAADTDEDMVEVIEVSGIRGSVIRAMDIKRSSQGVVDAISAEDIGKFPDTNLAESLQRITGVSIDRSNGEGSKVTVRGFGPDFNLVTLNGRHMPASSLEATSASSSRSFDFGNLAAEGVAGVEVYKTGRADVPTGGLGSTINIITTKPLNAPGLKATFGVKGVIDESSDEGSSITPELSGLYSNTFADDTFGVALSASYQERESGNQQANSGGWRTFPGNINGYDWAGGNAEWGGLIPDGDNAYQNYPDASDIYSVPQSLGYAFHEIERVRTNGQLTLQYRPVDSVTATLDYTYAKNEVDDRYNDVSAWFNFGPSKATFSDGPVAAPIVYSEAFGAPGDLAMGGGSFSTVNENKSLGFNIEWEASDNLELMFDIHDSSADSTPNSPWGSNNVIGTATWVRAVTTADFSSDFPVLSIQYPDGVNSIQAEDVRVTGSSFRNSLMESDIMQARLEGSYTFDSGILESIDFGVSTSEMKNRSAFSNVQQDNWGGLGGAGDIPAGTFMLEDIASKFDAGASGSSALHNEFFAWDFDTIRAIADSTYGVAPNGGVGDCGSSFCASSDFTTDRRTQEDIDAVYLQFNLASEMGSMPYTLAVGARYEETEVTANALVPNFEYVVWAGANELPLQAVGDGIFTELTGDYSNFLPSIDFSIDLTDDLVARASYSKTMARPGYRQIQGGTTVDALVRVDGGSGYKGNPDLDPIKSTNYDLSLEWYYDEGSYASVGYFRKNSTDFIGEMSIQETTYNIPHPTQGPRYQEALAAVGQDAALIREYMIANFPDSLNDAGQLVGVAGEDDPIVFNLITPINQEDASVDGFELAVQHLFGESGFGMIANATFVDGDLEYDNTSQEAQFALLGMSDSYNLIGFYDKDGIQVRLAYNWRDDYLASFANSLGLQNPIYVEDYGQWDVNVSYEFNENLTFFVEGINITDEARRSHERSPYQLANYTETGPRYNIGARYTF